MKNKTKKFLAGACLGLVGMGCLTGCAMSDEQKSALDLITNKADEIVNLLEDNLEFNNNKLTKEDAAEKILLARAKLDFYDFDQFEMSMIQNAYTGIFDELSSTYTSDENTPFRFLYRKNNNTKVLASVEGEDNFDYIITSDFELDKHYKWTDTMSSMEEREYSTLDFTQDFYLLNQIGVDTINAEDIKDIVVNENGYLFKIFIQSEGEKTEVAISISFDGYLTKIVAKKILKFEQSQYQDENVVSSFLECTFKYDNVDFSKLDAKIAELSAQN